VTGIRGWLATAVFVASYFCARPGARRATQRLGATLWMIYGLLIGAEFASDMWEDGAWVRNLTGKFYLTSAADLQSIGFRLSAPRR
jgi:hypothetical protein